MSNLVLLRCDAYLEFVKQGVKPDTMNLLRNAPLFDYGSHRYKPYDRKDRKPATSSDQSGQQQQQQPWRQFGRGRPRGRGRGSNPRFSKMHSYQQYK